MTENNLENNYLNYERILDYSNTKKEQGRYTNYFRKNYGKYLPANKKVSILEIGCGTGHFLTFLKGLGYTNVIGVDLSPVNVEICKKHGLNVQLVEGFSYLEATETKFDLVVMNDVIEHIPKDRVIPSLKIIFRNLGDHGTLIIKTLNMANPISLDTLYCDFTHWWGYTEKSLTFVCLEAGFQKVRTANLVIFPNIVFIDQCFRLVYKWLHVCYRLKFLFYGKSKNRIFTKNILCVAHKAAL